MATKRAAIVTVLLLALAAAVALANEQQQQKCAACDRLAAAFASGLQRTAAHNFGGGNTDWEEKRLGSYAFSETRLVDISERLCKEEPKSSDCHSLLERFEEDIERWWFNDYKANQQVASLRELLCVNQSGLCCPYNSFGQHCQRCQQQPDGSFCSGHGQCNGNGTRAGTGVCDCDRGYVGQHCTDCALKFYRVSDKCQACHVSCKSACTGATAADCDACADGFVPSGNGECVDIDECIGSPCSSREFCRNKPGSYSCIACDPACASCSGPSSVDCTTCSTGYEPAASGQGCEDINECSPDSQYCIGQNERCVNTPGSFHCECRAGYERQAGRCVKAKKSASASRKKQQQQQQRGKSKKQKIIWTVAYTLEFIKFLGVIIALAIFANIVKGSIAPVLVASLAAAVYLFRQSSVLDAVYLRGY